MEHPLEIEYKFLIEYPTIDELKKLPHYKQQELCQSYLRLPEGKDENGTDCRIRCAKSEGTTRYIKTFKTRLTDMTRIEIETDITEEEYTELSRYIKPGTQPIQKNRHSFCLEGFTYEVDVFPFWQDRAFLEIEVDSEETVPPIPDVIKIIKDVTCDGRYRNSALAEEIITEPLFIN